MNIVLKDIGKSYGDEKVLENLHLTLRQGEITALLGESGVGKTTLLRILAGLTDFSGQIENAPSTVSMLFQEPRLVPQLTVRGNLDYALCSALPDKSARKAKINEILQELELLGAEKKYPNALSGGMQQRVALARAFLFPSPLLLMDEPFRGLDYRLKKQLITLFLRLWRRDNRTVLLVTHDVDEALQLADSLVVLSKEKGAIGVGEIALPQEGRVLTDPALLPLKSKILAELC